VTEPSVEMVVPQTFVQGILDGSFGGGGSNYTININALDTQTGAQFLKNNAGSSPDHCGAGQEWQ
jgi:hypothetical protein